MKGNWTLIIVLSAVIVLLITFRKPVKKAAEKLLSRGYRNNNPGNIRKTPSKWIGEVEGTDKDFKTFKSMPYGYRALFALLREYLRNGYDTIETIINRYAPSSENATENYIVAVEKKTGIARDRKLVFNKPDFRKIVAAISYVENGVPADQTDIENGLNLLA